MMGNAIVTTRKRRSRGAMKNKLPLADTLELLASGIRVVIKARTRMIYVQHVRRVWCIFAV